MKNEKELFKEARKSWISKFYTSEKVSGKFRFKEPIDPALYGRSLKPWEINFLEDLKCLPWEAGIEYLSNQEIKPTPLKVINYFNSEDNAVYDALAFPHPDLIIQQTSAKSIVSRIESCIAVYQNPGFKIYPISFYVVIKEG